MLNIVLVLGFVLFPHLIILLCNKFRVLKKVGPVLMAYAFGILLGNIGVLKPEQAKVIEYISMASILIALPLILFSSELKKWSKMAPKAILSLITGIVSLLITCIVGYWLFGSKMSDGWKVSGMIIGVYTGGTPNLAAIKEALDVNNELFILANTYDMFISAIYLLFLMSIGQKVFSFFLLSYRYSNKKTSYDEADFSVDDFFGGIFEIRYAKTLGVAFLLSLLIVGLSSLVGFQFDEKFQSAIIIILITTLGIIASFSSKIRRMEKSFELGMYLILIFCLSVSTLADVRQLVIVTPNLFYYIALAVFGTLIIQLILAYIFKIDTDTMIVTSTALICSPPFVPVVAGALRNKEVVLSGIAIGVIGFAIGNYLGIAVAYFLHSQF